jgi:hypothetical protein
VKILAKFLLSSVFVFLPAVGCARDILGIHEDCGFPPALKIYTSIGPLGASATQLAFGFDELKDRVNMLVDGQNCLDINLIRLRTSVKNLHTQMGWIADSHLEFRNEIQDLQDKLKRTELDLHTAETKIETLEDRLRTAEEAIEGLNRRFFVFTAPAGKPKAPLASPRLLLKSRRQQ